MEKDTLSDLRYFLKEMFQFNYNDLDFGIFKIYNLKREQISQFIDGNGENDLAAIIDSTLSEIKVQTVENELYDLKDVLGRKADWLNDPTENYQLILNFIDAVEPEEADKYKKSLENVVGTSDIDQKLKDHIYNHILGFFQMYYAHGDFGYNNRSRDLYKVPYEADYDGSDTLFHWKHKGSLYIKTGTSFNAVKFTFRDKELEFRLETNEQSEGEEISQNNNKDANLKHYQLNRIEEVDGVWRIIFNFAEKSTPKAEIYQAIYSEIFGETDIDQYIYFEKTRTVKGEKVTQTEGVFNDLTADYDKVQGGSIKGLSALRSKKKTVADNVRKKLKVRLKDIYDAETKTILEPTLADLYSLDHKLNSFYIGHDADYFIHEDLHGFLTNEKERYVKNYIFSDLQAIYNGKLDNSTIIVAKAFDLISSRIIEFLSAIEEFQKDVFTRKKKVVESEYCLTIDNINPKYYPEILTNAAQLADWKNLYSLDIKTEADLKANPTLVLDTKHFRQADGGNPFKDNILNEIDHLDERTNGLLINSENYQALNLLQEKYRERVKCVYIDPPYNTGKDGFRYKDSFRSSSYLALINQTIAFSHNYIDDSGALIVSCDENEFLSLGTLLNQIFNKKNHLETITWNKRVPKNDKGVGNIHEYIYLFAKSEEYRRRNDLSFLMRKDGLEDIYELIRKAKSQNLPLDETQKRLKQFYRKNGFDRGITLYCELDENYEIWGKINMSWPNPQTEGPRYEVINPVTKKPTPVPKKGWRWTEESFRAAELNGEEFILPDGSMMKGRIWYANDEKTQPSSIKYLREVESFLLRSIISLKSDGSLTLEGMGLGGSIDYPKPVKLLEWLCYSVDIKEGYFLDFFAGSGTTGQAIINLNLDDNGDRKYLLVEMGEYFDISLKPRIQKVIYSQNWKDGKPQDKDGSPKHIFKYLVLEQYEDILDHIEAEPVDYPQDLPLKYLYRPEQNRLDSTLDLSRPFSNKIQYGKPSKTGYVDLVDTYNYLMGYHLQSLKTYHKNGRIYKVAHSGSILVIWRNIDLNEDDTDTIKNLIGKYEGIHHVEVNHYFELIKEADRHGTILLNGDPNTGKQEIQIHIIQTAIFNR